MQKYIWVAAIAITLVSSIPALSLASPWGRNYFPNVVLTTHEGKEVRFFDDLIRDKVVAINFIYTRCPDTCPLETAQLVRVQKIIGDRLGRDVFFYSISIDPENDTPQVLNDYRERFGANWTFLTGDKDDIILLRKKLGLYIAEIQDGSNNHNVSMIIGNQATGCWMKRSPFENPHVLADQIGNWLTGWKSSQARNGDYANAPELRSISRGEQIFRTRCDSCHTLSGEEHEGALGPDLLGVTQRRTKRWLYDWLQAPDRMLKEKDPIAISLYNQYNQLAMPNMRLNKEEAQVLLDYIESETHRKSGSPAPAEPGTPVTAAFTVRHEKPAADVVAVMNSWIREAHANAKVNAGYMTLVNVGSEDVTLLKVESDAFESVEVHEMTMVDGMMAMNEVVDLVIPAKDQVQFEPGGKHLMLMGPREYLTSGRKIDMTLSFKSGRKQTVSVGVAAR